MLKGKGWVMLHSAMVLLFWLLLGTTYWPVSNMNSRAAAALPQEIKAILQMPATNSCKAACSPSVPVV
jgi:hypothetical protein